MRFMMIVKATRDSEAGVMPGEQLLNAMTAYNEELARAGVLLDRDPALRTHGPISRACTRARRARE